MPSIGRPFGKEGVPRKDLALAALGVEVESDKGLDREREGAKGMDEIVLSEAEKQEAEKSENSWDRERMIQWAESLGEPEVYNQQWVEETFEFLPNGRIKCQIAQLDFSFKDLQEFPPYLTIQTLKLSCSSITTFPVGLKADSLHMDETGITEIPAGQSFRFLDISTTDIEELPQDLEAEYLYMRDTKIRALPEGMKISKAVVGGSPIDSLPTDLGALKSLGVSREQTHLIREAGERGFTAHTKKPYLYERN